MKILIVDDNVAIQEIIAEILTVDGYEIDQAGSVSEAVMKLDDFRPDALLLDSQVKGESGLKVLDALDEDSDVRALILTSGREPIPKDTPFIYGYIQKPFKSSEILSKVRDLASDMEMRPNKDKRFKFKLFAKHSSEDQVEGNDIDAASIRFGKSYVVFEDEPNDVYKLASLFVSKGCDVMVVTSGRIKSISERFKEGQVKTLGLSLKARLGYVEMSKLGTLMGEITQFIGLMEKPVVVIDDLAQIISVNGLNTVLTMVYQIINGGANKPATVIISTKEDILTDKDKELFLHDMELYEAQ